MQNGRRQRRDVELKSELASSRTGQKSFNRIMKRKEKNEHYVSVSRLPREVSADRVDKRGWPESIPRSVYFNGARIGSVSTL